METVASFIKMSKETHDRLVDFLAITKKMRISELSSKTKVIDKAVLEFITNHPIDKTLLPIQVKGVTKSFKELTENRSSMT